MGQAQGDLHAADDDDGEEDAEDGANSEWDDDADAPEEFDLDAFRTVAIRLLDEQIRDPPASKRRRRARSAKASPAAGPVLARGAASAARWGLADDKNVQVVADELTAFGTETGRPAVFGERGLNRVIAEYAVEYLPRFARLPPTMSMTGIPLSEIMYDAIWGSTPSNPGNNAGGSGSIRTAQLVYDHVRPGSCGWFERCTDPAGLSAFGHFVVVWKHPSPRARVLGIVFPHVRPATVKDDGLFGADLLSFPASEAAAAAIERQRCTCGVRRGRYFMGSHLAPCPVRAEYKTQLASVFAGAEIERAPADGFYRVHYLRYPRRFWVHSQIEHANQRVAIVHGVREQMCRFGVQPRKDRPAVGPEAMLPSGLAPTIFDILPERLLSAPFSTTREELASLGIDRESPRSRAYARRRPSVVSPLALPRAKRRRIA
jgi:hypothetical protein